MSWTPTFFIIMFCISAFFNVFFVWYTIKMIRELANVSSAVEEMFADIDAFSKHLKGVYELEMFYGDQTLENLLSHSTALKKELEGYKIFFSLIDATEINDDERFESEEAT